jgi:hypothetical protein
MSSSSEPFASRYSLIEPSRLQLRSDSNSYLAQEILPTAQRRYNPPLALASKTAIGASLLETNTRFTIRAKPGSSANTLQTNTPLAEHPGMGAPLEVVAS